MEDAQQPCGDDHVEKSKPKVNSNSAEEIHSVATINNVETSHLTINWFCVVLADQRIWRINEWRNNEGRVDLYNDNNNNNHENVYGAVIMAEPEPLREFTRVL